MNRLPVIRIGHLRIFDHLMLGFAYDGSGAALLKHTDHLMTAVSFGSWSQIKQAFCNGDLHGAFLPLPEAMALFDSGMEIKLVLFDSRPGAYIVGNRAAKVNKLTDFKGKTVLISNYLSVHNLLFYRLMASARLKAGLENDSDADVYIEIVPPFIVPEMLNNDESNEIGGVFIEEPFGSMVIKNGWGKEILPSSRIWTSHPSSVLIIHDYVIKDYRRHLMDIIHLMVASSHFIYKGSEDLYRLSREFFDKFRRFQDREILEFMFSSFLPNTPNSLMPDTKSLEVINRFMVNDMGIMKNIIYMDNFVDKSFAIEAGA
ncbi:MAG: ABC transporter substrate-binding protein [Desulfamplus sp.]|nr:ABC transporter substrate-binding protein [Desulfamplus sp.]